MKKMLTKRGICNTWMRPALSSIIIFASTILPNAQASDTSVADSLALTQEASQSPQIGFAHRVNDWDEIKTALSHGANGIEIDICWGGGALRSDDWYVSHNDADVCANPSAEHLHEWLRKLRDELDNNANYKEQLVALWIDVKDLSDYHLLDKAVHTIHNAYLPSDIKIIYDLTKYDNNSIAGFHKIRPLLRHNEGVSMCAGKSCGGNTDNVKYIYNLYAESKFTRGGFNSGDSVNIDESFLRAANFYKNIDSPYAFKFVHTWTNRYQSTMEDYVNPDHEHHTDGQIIGEWGVQYDWYMKYIIDNFRDAVNKFPTQRLANKSDPILGIVGDKQVFGALISDLEGRKCLDLHEGKAINGRKTVSWDCHGGLNQKWLFGDDGKIHSAVDKNKCLDPEGPSYATGTEVQIWDCIDSYQWHSWVRNDNGSISPKYAQQQCIEVQDSNSSNGVRIQLAPCNGGKNQKWYFEGDFKSIRTELGNNKCLDVPSATSGTDTYLWECHGGDNQKWLLDNTGKIRSLNNIHQCLDPEGPSYNNHTPIQTWECRDNYAPHQWITDANGYIKPKYAQDKCFDAYAWKTDNLTPVVLWDCHGGANQKWTFKD